MSQPRVLILRAPGTNCDAEAGFAFEKAGALTERLHVNALRENPALLRRFQILVLPGGFSYGDDVAAGKILAAQLQHFLADAIREFRDQDHLILGICNGFQTLLKAGLLVPPDEDGPLATLTYNSEGYRDCWVHLLATPGRSVFLKGVTRMLVPVAHGEGNFVCRKEWILQGLTQAEQVVLRYVAPDGGVPGFPDNPNGSQGNIAGICDATGRVLGLMPHPERHVLPTQHPRWTREGLKDECDGMPVFRNAVEYFHT
ncbi:MAG TPA: phosphoribosylformylglycinamidine synthase subunit PurQ [Fimbriiglobus sp.]|jgi:phosphoribosylformylglycinamidine synthase